MFTESPRDITQIRTLGQQAFFKKTRFIQESYKLATEKTKYGYLVISCDPGRNPLLRVASNIFQKPINIYIENTCKNKMNSSSSKCMYLVDHDMYQNILEVTSRKSTTKRKVNNGDNLSHQPRVSITNSNSQIGG